MSNLSNTLICDGFEHGLQPDTVGAYGGTRGTVTIGAPSAINGDYGLNVAAASELAGLRYVTQDNTQYIIGQVRFRVNVLPTDDCFLIYVAQASGSTRYTGLGFNATTNCVRLFGRDTAGTHWEADGPEIAAGQEYLYDWFQNGLAFQWAIDEVAQADTTLSLLSGGVPGRLFLGNYHDHTTTLDFDFDDVLLSRYEVTRRPTYPISPGKVSLIDGSGGEGTHVNDTDFTDNAANSPPVDPDVKLSSHLESDSTYIEQTTGDATSYLELLPSAFVDVDDPVNGLIAWFRRSGSGTIATKLKVELDGATHDLVGNTGTLSVPTWDLANLASGATDPTIATLEAMKIRVGYDPLSDAVTSRTYDVFFQIHTGISVSDPPEPPPEPDPEVIPSTYEGDWIYIDQLEGRGGESVQTLPEPPQTDDTASDTFAFTLTPRSNTLMIVFLQAADAGGAEVPTSVTHAGLDGGFDFEGDGQVVWDTGDTPLRMISVWAAATGAAPTSDDLVVTFANPMDSCSIVVAYASGYDPADPIGAFAAAVNSDASVSTLTPALEIDFESTVYAAVGFNNTDGVDAAASDGTLIGLAEVASPANSLAAFNAGADPSPTLVWETSSPAGAVAIEVKKKKPTPTPANVLPTASVTVTPDSGSAPLSVTADASASTDSDGSIVSYAFAWGDGTSNAASASPTATHTYTTAGTYVVRVTVTDNAGAIDTSEDTVTVAGSPPSLVALLTGTLSRGSYSAGLGPDGYNPEISWATLEPSEGSLVTTALDNAIASGHPFRLRLEAGLGTPSWVKSATGAVTVVNPQSGIRGTVAKWWTPTFLTKWTNFVNALAAGYDETDIVLVFSAACMTVYAEPCLRGFTNKETLTNLRSAGLTAANDVAAQKNTTDALAAAFDYARIGMAFNPYQLITATNWKTDEPTTMALMTYFRQQYGKRFVLQNNSLRDYSQGAQYDQMYADIRALGKPFSFQTSTWSRIAAPGETKHQGLVNVLNKAISWGAHAVEMPAGHDLTGPQLTSYGNLLDANA